MFQSKGKIKVTKIPFAISLSVIALSLLIALGVSRTDVLSIVDNSRSALMPGMMGMMNTEPKDAIISVKSKQILPVGKESEIKLLIHDKDTQKPLSNADVIIGIERGTSMSIMDMVTPMFEATEQKNGSGVYIIKFTPNDEGIYTLHTHVISPGEPSSMHTMMENHLDIGIIAK